jgi:hypothetical protein
MKWVFGGVVTGVLLLTTVVAADEAPISGTVKQSLALTDLKPGWIVSVETKHEGNKEVAELVKVVLER